MEEFIQSPDAPTYRDLFEKWKGDDPDNPRASLKYLKVTAADGKWFDKRKEYWHAKEVSDVPEGAPRLRAEDRDLLDGLTYDLDSGAITLDEFRTKALPPLLRGLISLSGSASADLAFKAIHDMAHLVTARPTDDVETISRYERTKPEDIIDALADIEAGREPSI
jgi:hypothetical protein